MIQPGGIDIGVPWRRVRKPALWPEVVGAGPVLMTRWARCGLAGWAFGLPTVPGDRGDHSAGSRPDQASSGRDHQRVPCGPPAPDGLLGRFIQILPPVRPRILTSASHACMIATDLRCLADQPE